MTDDESPRPFRVDVPSADLDDLRERLARTRWPVEQRLEGRRGLPLDQVRALAARWADGWDWRAQEAALNRWPQLTTTIDGTLVHALHVRSPQPGAPTLVLLHGWPGSVVEFARVVGPLTDPAAHGGDPADAVSLVVPSLPGYGFSGPTPDGGWTTTRMAAAVAELLRRLDVDRYVVHGGDWGSAVGRDLAVLAPDRVQGLHVTMTMGLEVTDPATDAERAAAEKSRYYDAELAGYNRLQATRPLSLAPALSDSPVGLLAWIAERFAEWTDPASGVLTDPGLVDQVLTDVAVYWFTGTAGSSSQVYWERAHGPATSWSTDVPTGVAVFPHDLRRPVRRVVEPVVDLVSWTEFDRGGHFPAVEVPDLLVPELRRFVRQVG
ncbi:epoxide hydrolase family protein [Modestobacter sp. NPDC049651]|uniref:epoxide hydrolase family protein n=1 Tax=unclassified Modestobacter TaxID=2643866 RepID=UPI00340B18DB